MKFRKLLSKAAAVVLSLGMIGMSPPFSPGGLVGPDASMTADAATCFVFDSSSGLMTLKGDVDSTEVRKFENKESVKSIVARTGTTLPSYSSYLFEDYTQCTSIDLSNADSKSVRSTAYMFYNCKSLENIDLSGFDASHVADMSFMFFNCKKLTELDLNSFSTPAVTNITKMFCNCESLETLDLSSFDIRNVTNDNYLFLGCNKISELRLGSYFEDVIEEHCLSNGPYGWTKNGSGTTVSGSGTYAVIYNQGENTYKCNRSGGSNTVTITIWPGTGSGSLIYQQAVIGSTFTFPQCSFTPPEGYIFEKWYSVGRYFKAGQTFTVPSYNFDIEAVYKVPGKFIVSFSPGSFGSELQGTGTMNSLKVDENSIMTLPDCTYTPPAGYEFDSWGLYTLVGYYPGDPLKVTSDITLYAVWRKTGKRTVFLDPGDGSGTMDDIILESGECFYFPECTFDPPPGMEFDHWKLAGWMIDLYPDDRWPITEEKNYVEAQWRYMKGDINGDCKVNIADGVLLQKWLLYVPNTELAFYDNADMDINYKTDIYDLILLKEKIADSGALYTVRLESPGDARLSVVKAVYNYLGCSLKEAQSIVNAAPVDIATGIKRSEAEELAATIEKSGGTVSIIAE